MRVDIYTYSTVTRLRIYIGVKKNCTMFNSDYYIAIIVVGYNNYY